MQNFVRGREGPCSPLSRNAVSGCTSSLRHDASSCSLVSATFGT
ncbi:MAG: hypothetical protein ACI8PT_000751 [Gammaproteobacteria bacterium]|jgi:hypothetical protein